MLHKQLHIKYFTAQKGALAYFFKFEAFYDRLKVPHPCPLSTFHKHHLKAPRIWTLYTPLLLFCGLNNANRACVCVRMS